jgi:hypothetical protein
MLLPAEEYYLANVGYKDQTPAHVCRQDMPNNEKRRFDVLMARHETVNRRFNEWGITMSKIF